MRALILTPTRELALQIDENIQAYGKYLKLRSAVLMGGVPAGPQIKALKRRPDILVATPGRLLDMVAQGEADLGSVEILVLDEADRMLDMGFILDVRRIVARLPKKRQTLLFSATLPPEVGRMAADMLRTPSQIDVAPPAAVADNILQHVFYVDRANKRALLADVLKGKDIERALVFTRTKRGADRLTQQLSKSGIRAAAIHSDKSQGARQKALSEFDRGRVRILIGTDVVARGIDVDGISHVINYELPEDPERYVHRIGRTARAGAAGIALSFCGADEVPLLHDIERLIRNSLTAQSDHPYHSDGVALLHRNGNKRNGHRNGKGSGRQSEPFVVVEPLKSATERTFGRRRVAAAAGRRR